MPMHRSRLPQLDGGLFLTDGGLETTLIFREGLPLPEFAAFDLLKTEAGVQTLRKYFSAYARMAQRHGIGLILESPTWRASRDWGRKLGYSADGLADANRQSIALLDEIRDRFATEKAPAVISGNLGPRGDGYVPSALMSAAEAMDYHAEQIRTFASTEADMVAAFTMNYVEEAIGVALAARAFGMPVAIAFTVETDGALPTGQTLREAIERTDDATGSFPAYYMINCAHPVHFGKSLAPGGDWLDRIRGLRANASTRSHAELNEAPDLDDGDPVDLGKRYKEMNRVLRRLNVIGGCCGTDDRHVEEMCKALLA
jgi:homocysteine S-methyltransferase